VATSLIFRVTTPDFYTGLYHV